MRIEQKLTIPMIVIAIGNAIKGVFRGDEFIYYITHVFVFIVISLTIILFKKIKLNEKIAAFIMLLFSIFSAIPADINAINVFFFLLFSISTKKLDKKIYWVYGITVLSTVMKRFETIGANPSSVINYIAAILFIFIFYQYFIHPKIKSGDNPQGLLKLYDSRKVKDQVVDIVHLKVQGYDWPEINDKLFLNVSNDRVRRIVTDERNRLGFSNQEEFVFWMTVSGIIQPKSDDLITRV